MTKVVCNQFQWWFLHCFGAEDCFRGEKSLVWNVSHWHVSFILMLLWPFSDFGLLPASLVRLRRCDFSTLSSKLLLLEKEKQSKASSRSMTPEMHFAFRLVWNPLPRAATAAAMPKGVGFHARFFFAWCRTAEACSLHAVVLMPYIL